MKFIDEKGTSDASPRTSQLHEKLHKLETYQVDDLIQMLHYKRYCLPGKRVFVPTCSPSKSDQERKAVINASSFVSFVFLMNDIVRDWMLVEGKRPKVEVPKHEPETAPSSQPNKKLSKIEQRLLGLNFIQDKQKQYL